VSDEQEERLNRAQEKRLNVAQEKVLRDPADPEENPQSSKDSGKPSEGGNSGSTT
jgi:hypothetical protein